MRSGLIRHLKAEVDAHRTRRLHPRDFRETWAGACKAAVPGLLLHDLRRPAARNLRRAGIAEGIIMKIGGWCTRSVFERYATVSQTDIADGRVQALIWFTHRTVAHLAFSS
jgi:hypothetical protein